MESFSIKDGSFCIAEFLIFLPLFQVFLDKPSISIWLRVAERKSSQGKHVPLLRRGSRGSPLHVTRLEGSFTCVPHLSLCHLLRCCHGQGAFLNYHTGVLWFRACFPPGLLRLVCHSEPHSGSPFPVAWASGSTLGSEHKIWDNSHTTQPGQACSWGKGSWPRPYTVSKADCSRCVSQAGLQCITSLTNTFMFY